MAVRRGGGERRGGIGQGQIKRKGLNKKWGGSEKQRWTGRKHSSREEAGSSVPIVHTDTPRADIKASGAKESQ